MLCHESGVGAHGNRRAVLVSVGAEDLAVWAHIRRPVGGVAEVGGAENAAAWSSSDPAVGQWWVVGVVTSSNAVVVVVVVANRVGKSERLVRRADAFAAQRQRARAPLLLLR